MAGTITVLGKMDYNAKNYDLNLFTGNIDVCNIGKGMRSNFIISMIYDNLKDHSNFKFECPTKKGFYYAANFPIMGDEYLPHFLIGQTGYWQVIWRIKAKIQRSKSPVPLALVKYSGSYFPLN